MPVDLGWLWWVAIPVGVVVIGVIGQLVGVMDFTSAGKDGRRTAGNILAPIDGLFAPTRQEALQEQERQTELPAPAPTPGDPLLDLDAGVARIHLDAGDRPAETPTER